MRAKTWIIRIVCVLLFGAIVCAVVFFVLKKLDEPTGMYIEHEGQIYEAEDSGIPVQYKEEALFTLKHADGWGLYSVSECKVKVFANTTEGCNFSYTLDGEDTSFYFSLLTDITAAFIEEPTMYDGAGLAVNADGEFFFYVGKEYTMETAISRLQGGKKVTIESEVDITAYPYFVLEVTSPDGTEVIRLPFTLTEIYGEVVKVEFDVSRVAF